MAAYYNEIDAYAAEWLRNLIKAGHIADGEVDTRSIVDVQPDELREFTQCHFFAGIAGWSHALRLAGWEDDRQIWTGSCPCQPFSVAGQGKGVNDERHLWPHFFRLIRGCRPSVVMGEQVAGAAGYGWLDGVRSDLEGEDYSCQGVDIAACSVNAPHIRQRLYWVAKDMVNPDCCWGEGHILHHPTKHWRNTRDEFGHGSGDSRTNSLDNTQSERLEGWVNNTAKPSIETRDGDTGETGCDTFDMADTDINGCQQRWGSESSQIQRECEERKEEQTLSRNDGELSGRVKGLCGSSLSRSNNLANANSGGCVEAGERGTLDTIHPGELHDGMPAAERDPCGIDMADTNSEQLRGGHAREPISPSSSNEGEAQQRKWLRSDTGADGNSFWHNSIWLNGADGKTRRAQPGVRLLAHGVPARVGKLRAYGNAIVPPLAAEVIKAFMETL